MLLFKKKINNKLVIRLPLRFPIEHSYKKEKKKKTDLTMNKKIREK